LKGEKAMKPPTDLTRIVNRHRYSVTTATLLAADDWWDGHNFERHGRNTFLYRTRLGAYFVVNLSQWQNEQTSLEPVQQEEALRMFEEELTEHRVTYGDAFPDVKVEEA
jgi:hypothetical protein